MPNEDPKSGENHQVKLFFDVMPEAAGKTPGAEIRQIKTTSVFPPPPPPPAAPPKYAQPPEPEQPPVSVPGNGSKSRAGFKLSMPKFNIKILAVIGVIVVLAVGSYFAYRYFATKGESTETANLRAQVQKPPQQPLPAEWLKKYFGSDTCDITVCGPDADPDKDGLKNSKELQYSTSPLNPDSDFDGLADSDEVQIYNSDPLVSDTDGDGFEDGVEVRNGYSPTASSQSPMSNMEKTVFSDNISAFGLHEPTKTFLSLETFKSAFTNTNSQITFSYPTKFVWSVNQGDARLILLSTSTNSLIAVNTFPVSPTSSSDILAEVRVIDSASTRLKSEERMIKGAKYILDEFTTDLSQVPQAGLSGVGHVLWVIWRKDDTYFRLTFNTDHKTWDSMSLIANTIVNSAR